MFVVTVEFEVKAENAEPFRGEMLLQAKNSLTLEEACRQFDVCFDAKDPTKCFLYEKYDDESAFEVHLASDHFKRFDAKVSPWTKSKTVRHWKQASVDL